jgi:hypothetical protein
LPLLLRLLQPLLPPSPLVVAAGMVVLCAPHLWLLLVVQLV